MRRLRSFHLTVVARAAHDTRFRECLLAEAMKQLLRGDPAVGKAMLRDYLQVTEHAS